MNGGREAQLANPGAPDPGRPSEPRAPEPIPFQPLTRGRGAGGGGRPDDRPALRGRELPASGPDTRTQAALVLRGSAPQVPLGAASHS